jgi:hypothetical protein
MPLGPPKIASAAWAKVPAPLRRKLGSHGGRRLVRFAPAALLALATTQITYFICFSVLAMKPRLLRETLPFVAISLVVGIVLTEASHFGYREAAALGLHGATHDVFVQGFYLAANCCTFLIRFVIFHFVLFADRDAKRLGVEDV